MPRIALTVNGNAIEAEAEPRTHLADFLREQLHLTGTHIGCEHGICGACTVEIDGEIARACITYAVACDGAAVRTIEGFDDDALMERLRRAFSEEHALQCGYCTPGVLIAARDLIRRRETLDAQQIRLEMSGNLCRCTGYMGIVAAVERVAAEAGDVRPPPEARSRLGPAPGPEAESRIECTGSTASKPLPAEAAPGPAAPAVTIGDLGPEADLNRLTQNFVVPHPRARVWAFMSDIEKVATCLPGVTLDGPVTDDHIAGHMAVKLGPIAARFAGDARVTRDAAAYRGAIEGAGRDSSSASRAKGRVEYTLSEEEDGATTRVDVSLAYALTGPLAQFSRGSLVRDLVARLTDAFAQNLEARISAPEGAPVAPAAELRAGSLFLSVLMDRVKALLRRWFGRAP
ncbi:MAG: xanthine dehydrogenase family Fe-S subunit [Methyloligellaceae bacterium]